MKKRVGIILSLILMMTSFVGCSSNSEDKVENDVKQNVSITYVKSPLNVPSIVEKNKKMFEKNFGENDCTVNYSDLTTGPEQTQALASGDIQFLNAVGGTSVILSAANGADIKIMSIYSRSPKAFKIISKDDSIKSAEDLKGKKIGGPKGTILHELLTAYLAKSDMKQDDVKFINMGIPDAMAALTSGEIDAALMAGPAAYNLEKDGYNIVTNGEGLTEATIVTATSQKFYDEHPNLVKVFLETQKETTKYMNDNYDEIIKITAKETELSEEAVKEMYPLYDFNSEIKDSDIAALKNTEKFMKDNNMIENDVNIDDLILKQK